MNPSDHTRVEGPKNAFSSEVPRSSGNDRSLSPGWVLPQAHDPVIAGVALEFLVAFHAPVDRRLLFEPNGLLEVPILFCTPKLLSRLPIAVLFGDKILLELLCRATGFVDEPP